MTNKKQSERGLFDELEQLEKLSKMRDPLEKLSQRIDFEAFRETLNGIYLKTDRKSLAGAKPFDAERLADVQDHNFAAVI